MRAFVNGNRDLQEYFDHIYNAFLDKIPYDLRKLIILLLPEHSTHQNNMKLIKDAKLKFDKEQQSQLRLIEHIKRQFYKEKPLQHYLNAKQSPQSNLGKTRFQRL